MIMEEAKEEAKAKVFLLLVLAILRCKTKDLELPQKKAFTKIAKAR